ncbi:MAG TPA: polymer-forming cytoskeletal protein [Candidatus Bathyarchaeia archaeon]|nr:polymer-forming cytoskeletal protein [Candidatus Bathyarchaeia archaeon]
MKADETARLVRKHVQSNTYIIKDEAFFEKSVHVRGSLITGSHVGFWGDLIVEGSLSLGNRSTVRGNIRAESAFIGNDAEIGGILTTTNDATLLDGVRLGEIDSARSVTIKPDAVIDRIVAEGNAEISGEKALAISLPRARSLSGRRSAGRWTLCAT